VHHRETSSASECVTYLPAIYLGQARGVARPGAGCGVDPRASPRCRGWPGACWKDAWRGDRYRQLAERFHPLPQLPLPGAGHQLPGRARVCGLKLKEISYIHAEGYPAGEMKHGPIALIDANKPTVVVAILISAEYAGIPVCWSTVGYLIVQMASSRIPY
jgi:hypothetical protein